MLHSQSFNNELQHEFMKVLLECSIMSTKCANLLRWRNCSFLSVVNVNHLWWMRVLCANDIRGSQNLEISELDFKIKTSGLIHKCHATLS